MPGIAEIGAEIVEVALTFIPSLEGIPVLGRILRLIAPGGGNDFKALEELQAQANKRKTDRATRIAKNARYVIKASDAMQCVEDNLMTGAVWLALGKSFVNILTKSIGFEPGAGDLLAQQIFLCIESKVLKQTSRRTLVQRKAYHRPSRGHGHGRGVSPPNTQK